MTCRNSDPSLAPATFVLGALLAMGLLGCAGAPVRGAEPEDMTHDAHEGEARRHDAKARDAAASGDPTGAPALSAAPRLQAARHRDHAAAHRRAASVLATRHEVACDAVSAADMATCPFAEHAIVAVTDIDSGVRLRLAPDSAARAEHVLAHARCHAAHGAYEGRGDMPDCPFYVRDLRVERGQHDGEEYLDLRTSTPADLDALRARAHALISPGR